MMLRKFNKSLLLLIVLCLAGSARAQVIFFTDAAEAGFATTAQKRVIVPEKYRTLRFDDAAFSSLAKKIPSEKNTNARVTAPVIGIPMPDGTIQRFRVWETVIMEPALALANPDIKTYSGQGIDDPTATIAIDITVWGFHGMILSASGGAVFIDPYDLQTTTNYISYYKSDYKKTAGYKELQPRRDNTPVAEAKAANTLAAQCFGTQLRTYRLAVACTHQYAIASTGLANPTKAQVLAKITTSVNRINSIYERDLAIRLSLVAAQNDIIFVTAATDPFTGNDDAEVLIDESQTQITQRIGNSNYDIGHTFSTGTYGYAQLASVCRTGQKAMGVTGTPQPYGDGYDIDFVCHEIGHQFGADHSFNNANSCGSTYALENAEPGSGSTIMGYAGVCLNDNLQNASDAMFHSVSIEAIATYSINQTGNNCAQRTNTGNTPPVVNAGPDYIIPKSTPFVFTGTATDVNGDALTYSWDQVDVGGPNGSSANPTGNAPLFRSFLPVTTGTRFFPRLSDVINNTTSIGERLPDYARTMKFRLTVRDNRAGGGGVCFDENLITVEANAGPFVVTSPNTAGITWFANEFRIVTWNTAGTNSAPINCSLVNIQLSTDGGLTFPITLAANTPNDGSEEIQVPNNLTATARIRVIAVGNIFYDMCNFNFSIQTAPTASFVFNTPAATTICGNSGVTTLKTGSLRSFATAINLTASLNPAGTTVVFGTNPLLPGNNTTVTLQGTSGLTPGNYTVRVTGVAGSVTQVRDLTFVVAGQTTPPTTLTLPANDATGQPVKPVFNWVAVTGVTGYILEISNSASFAVIRKADTLSTTLPHTLSVALGEDSVYYWRVKSYSAGCGAGTEYSPVFRFKTGVNTCRISTDVPKTISATGTPTVVSTLTVPAAMGATITDINVVGLNISHSYIADLTVTLTSPTNTSVVLFNGICGGAANFNLNLDDQAAAAISCPPNGGGNARPQNLLSAFNGQNSAGTWTLTVKDNADQDGGTLNSWGLSINTNSNSCTITATPIVTTYTFTGNGNWNVAANWSNNTIPPANLPSGSEIIINHIAGGQCVLNVSQTIGNGASLTVLTGKNLVVPGTLTLQ
ncbi:MAG TPA: zinc-dependent metalloprotease family protein [Ferruginibacter sp.]|nr:zinc-dependent metalloprotease family protein [Ferruginibacter sp.]HMP21854.1 zinc-dependent metalloprotease family protein [Ferruginibacter sp.]